MVGSKPSTATILWDLENCLPSDISPGDAAALILRVGAAHNNIRKFQAFYIANSQNRVNWCGEDHHLAQQAYLQCLQLKGVEPVECSFLDGDSLDKAMTIELFTDIIDGGFHAPPTVIIISPSKTMEYAAAKLQLKKCKVVLYKTWNEIYEASQGEAETSIEKDLPAERQDIEQFAGDPMVEMGYLDTSVTRQFHVLIEVLWENMGKGLKRVSRADIGNLLIRHDANVYQDAGFTNKNAFKNYIATAEVKEVIRSGGGGSEAWVELRLPGDRGFPPGSAN